MSQDSIVCAKCGKPCGYDDRKGYWSGGGKAICGECKDNLVSRFAAFFGLQMGSSDTMGITVEWSEVDQILSNIRRDYAMRVSYIVTDKDVYARTTTGLAPIEEG